MSSVAVGSQILVTGTLEYRDAEGNLLKTVELRTTLPADAADLPPDDLEADDGLDL